MAVTLVTLHIYIDTFTKNVTLFSMPCQNQKRIKRLMLGYSPTHWSLFA